MAGRWFCDLFQTTLKRTYEWSHNKSLKKYKTISSQQLQFILEGISLLSVKKRVRYEHHFVDKKSVIPGVSAMV